MKKVYEGIDADGDFVKAEQYEIDELEEGAKGPVIALTVVSTADEIELVGGGKFKAPGIQLLMTKESLLAIADVLREEDGHEDDGDEVWLGIAPEWIKVGDTVRVRTRSSNKLEYGPVVISLIIGYGSAMELYTSSTGIKDLKFWSAANCADTYAIERLLKS